jgi:hypothetical protein
MSKLFRLSRGGRLEKRLRYGPDYRSIALLSALQPENLAIFASAKIELDIWGGRDGGEK